MANKKDSGGDKGHPPKKRRGAGGLIVLLVLALCAAGLFCFTDMHGRALGFLSKILPASTIGDTQGKETSADGAAKLWSNLVKLFEEFEMGESEYSYLPKDSLIEITAQVPRGRPMEWVIWKLSEAARGAQYDVEDCFCAKNTSCEVKFKSAKGGHPKVSLKVALSGRYLSYTAKMAIFIENLGAESDAVIAEYFSFPEPLTVSFAPIHKVQAANEHKKEVALLLPMEPLSPLPPQFDKYRKSMVIIHHNEAEIRGMISQAAATVPNFSGVCNFYGSRVMADSRVMEIILSEVHKRKGYFIYYYTEPSQKSVVPELAKSMKVPNMQIKGNIDAGHTAEQARDRMARYTAEAQLTGKILIKAQPSPAFMQALKEGAEARRRNGVKLVYVSELVK
jgi:polysaccharide deacetylase 2 family uncharacterized protein YibQ